MNLPALWISVVSLVSGVALLAGVPSPYSGFFYGALIGGGTATILMEVLDLP